MITFWPDRQTLQPVLRQSELDAVIAAGEIPVIAARGLFVVSGEAVVHAAAGIVDACEDARVFAQDAAAVRARDHARAWIEGRSRADAYDRAVVVAKGRSRVLLPIAAR